MHFWHERRVATKPRGCAILVACCSTVLRVGRPVVWSKAMDRLRRDDLDRACRTSPEVRAAQALEAMRTGFRLRWLALREQNPHASEAQIDELLRQWLRRDA